MNKNRVFTNNIFHNHPGLKKSLINLILLHKNLLTMKRILNISNSFQSLTSFEVNIRDENSTKLYNCSTTI